jgi:hypothetical protein
MPYGAELGENTKKVGQLSKKTRDLLIFIGAAIVVSTYIVKDIYRESLRDDLETIESAENLFLTQQRSSSLSTTLQKIRTDILVIGGRTASQDESTGKVREEYLSELRNIQQENMNDNVRQFEDQIRLLERLPLNAEEQKQLNEFKADVAIVKSKFGMLQDEIRKASEVGEKPNLADNDAWDARLRKYEGNSQSEKKMLKTTQEAANRALEQAKRKEDERRKRYEWFKTASIYLYFSGFLVGLIGRLIGVDGVADG